MATMMQTRPVLDSLSRQYSRRFPGGGDARWLAHAWGQLAGAGYVPARIPEGGRAGADARIRLAVLARLSEEFWTFGAGHHPGGSARAEAVRIDEGPGAIGAADVLDWMRIRDVPRQPDLFDPSGSALTGEDIGACLDRVEREMLAALAVVTGFERLFAELSAQRLLARGELTALRGDEREEEPLDYPLSRTEQDAILDQVDADMLAARCWLEQTVPHIRR
ncbi:hypothetical protein [Brachybacterium hainanense]|uniref:Uncharacterized protein n=1 Tax=Brachybacterium hainanense TaxID=1541174 RepID=A0ABV6R8E6_9MICO